jgi:hypothetical protein
VVWLTTKASARASCSSSDIRLEPGRRFVPPPIMQRRLRSDLAPLWYCSVSCRRRRSGASLNQYFWRIDAAPRQTLRSDVVRTMFEAKTSAELFWEDSMFRYVAAAAFMMTFLSSPI